MATNDEPETRIGKLAMKVDDELEEQRCPRCHALLFRADAEGQVEIKCRKCGRVIKRILSRVTQNKPLMWSPTEGQGQSESPERPIAQRWGNEQAKSARGKQ